MPAIRSLVEQLPRSGRPWKARSEQSITSLVIHHTAGNVVSGDKAIETLERYARDHIQRHGWPSLGYHYAIGGDGMIYKCNGYTSITYHAKGGNTHGIGIALLGNFMTRLPNPEQLESLLWLIRVLQKAIPSAQTILAHREVKGSATACPGDLLMQWIRTARQDGTI